ncbi:MAG: asparagine synthetase [Candidatus Thorarchaeota archaeon]|nr:MAG: asparagine synthetase [Candidatus Thorarchaeota archaeon]RLI56884.1 MAG: asparagine synthetase [Candidatus Thorarchaeota archaeon]
MLTLSMPDNRLLSALRVQSRALETAHRFFREEGFVELMPIILSTTTDPVGPDPGSRIMTTPHIEYLGQNLVLTQSMILHKQILVSSGIEKLYIVSPNVRLESPERKNTHRHLFEFSQVDFEIAGAVMEDVFRLMEGLICTVTRDVLTCCGEELEVWDRKLRVPRKFKRYTTADLRAEYGEDWEVPASMNAEDPFWVLNHKREFYDAEDPFRPGTYLNYDLIYPEGYGEALSGAEREWQYDRIVSRIERDGLPLEQFASYLEYARKGFVPSAGAGFGVERLTRWLVGAQHVGDVQSFRRVPGERVTV